MSSNAVWIDEMTDRYFYCCFVFLIIKLHSLILSVGVSVLQDRGFILRINMAKEWKELTSANTIYANRHISH